MKKLLLHCIADRKDEWNPEVGIQRRTTIKYREGYINLDISIQKSCNISCPCCGKEITFTVYPGLSIKRSLIHFIKDGADKGMRGCFWMLLLFTGPVSLILSVVYSTGWLIGVLIFMGFIVYGAFDHRKLAICSPSDHQLFIKKGLFGWRNIWGSYEPYYEGRLPYYKVK
jgi:hypothetical protein